LGLSADERENGNPCGNGQMRGIQEEEDFLFGNILSIMGMSCP
jgi:hypothetical protein